MVWLQSIFFLFHLAWSVGSFHPIHVSVTEIEMDEKDKRLEIMMRVFADDLELTFRKSFNQPELDILGMSEKDRDQLIAKYLRDHFNISLDGKPKTTNYLGHEQEDLALIFYIEVAGITKWNTIQIRNDIIMETYDDQSNLVHVTFKEEIRSLRLTKSNPVDKLKFDF
jgi:5'-3' exonuclease